MIGTLAGIAVVIAVIALGGWRIILALLDLLVMGAVIVGYVIYRAVRFAVLSGMRQPATMFPEPIQPPATTSSTPVSRPLPPRRQYRRPPSMAEQYAAQNHVEPIVATYSRARTAPLAELPTPKELT